MSVPYRAFTIWRILSYGFPYDLAFFFDKRQLHVWIVLMKLNTTYYPAYVFLFMEEEKNTIVMTMLINFLPLKMGSATGVETLATTPENARNLILATAEVVVSHKFCLHC